MNPIFKYGKKIDRTLVWLAIAVLFALPLTFVQFLVPKDEFPADISRKLIVKTTLWTDDMPSEVTLKKGEEVRVLGFVEGNHFYPHQVWVETSNGFRGYVPVEALDNKAVIYPDLGFRQDSSDVTVVHRGDTVLIMDWEKSFSTYEVLFSDRTQKEVRQENLHSPFADLYDYRVKRGGDGWRPMSEKKFKKIYMSEPISEAEKLTPAHFKIKDKSGNIMVVYPVKVFKDGKFYSPTLRYDSHGNPDAYSFPENPQSSINSWLLKYLPFYGSICDLPLVSNLWTKGVYETGVESRMAERVYETSVSGGNPIWFYILTYIIFLPLMVVFFLCPPLLIPMILFGLLRFPGVLAKLDNVLLLQILKIGGFLMLLVWIVLSLGEYYLAFIVVGLLILFWLFTRSVNKVLDRIYPSVRCQSCATLYSTEFDRKVEEGERRGGIERKKYCEKDVVTSVERWQTYTEVTKTNSDGHKSTHRENVRNHEKEHGIRTYGIYDEVVEYIPYTWYYICRECGNIETSQTEERIVLKRTKVSGYQEEY